MQKIGDKVPQGLFQERGFFWATIAGSTLLAGLFWYMTRNGLRITGDSENYMAAALSWRDYHQLLNADGSLYRYWGPLYPLLLSLGASTAATQWLHGAALMGNLVLWSLLGRRLLPTGRAMLLPLGLALSAAMMVPAAFVWSETVFACLLGAYCYCLLTWCQTARGQWLALATVAGFLLPLQRTAGMVLLIGAGVGLLVYRHRLRYGFLVLAHWVASAAGGLAWNYYAERIAGTRPNRGLGTVAKLVGSIADYGFVLLRWLLPLPTSWREPWLWPFALALPVCLALLWLGIRRNTADNVQARPALVLLFTTATVYLLGLLLAVNMTRGAAGLHDAERYAAVLTGPVMLLALAAWPAAAGRWAKVAQYALVGGWLAYSAVRVGHNVVALRQPVVLEVFPRSQ